MLHEGVLNFALLGAEWVLWLLVILSVVCFGVTIERLIYLIWDSTNRAQLGAAVNTYLKDGQTRAFRSKLSKLGGFEARILAAGLELHKHGPDAVHNAMVGTATAEKLRMERGLSILATVGSNAPFIGLLGTVLGIIQAFVALDLAEGVADVAVMGAIAEALVATAVGLGVAIPAVVLYNAFTRWVKSRLGRSESVADLVLARLRGESQPEVAAHGK